MYALQEKGINIADCIQALEALCSLSEDEFVGIGSRLKEFHSRAVSITEISSLVANLLSGKEITATVEGLNAMMQKVSIYINQSEFRTRNSIATLQSITQDIKDIDDPMDKLREITKTLRVLGISAIIQNANLKKSDHEFRLLGEDVKKLSGVIAEKSKNIRDGIGSLGSIISSSAESLRLLSESQQKKAAVILKKSMSSVCNLNEKYNSAADCAQDISNRSVLIEGSINNIVTLLQSHDIVHQKLEGSKKAFSLMFGDLEKKYEEKQDAFNASAHTERYLREILNFCASQGALLKQIQDEFIIAVSSIIESLGIVVSHVEAMLNKIRQVVSAEGFSRESSLSEVEGDLLAITSMLSTLSESILMRKELSETIASVVNTTEKMSDYIYEIEDIRDDIEIIALNAAVKAERVGAEGKALSVIADSIQAVSSETETYTGSLSQILKSIASHAEKLSADISSDGTAFDNELHNVSEELKKSVEFLIEINEKIMANLSEVDSSGKTLSKNIEEVGGNIKVHMLLDSTVSEILLVLSNIKAAIRNVLPGDGRDAYEMHPEPLISTAGKSGKKTGDKQGGFGDNVELFDS